MKRNAVPNTFIVGVPRAGTTSLFEYLGQHPEICKPPLKGLNYFDHPERLELYSKHYQGEKRILDGGHYFHSREAVKSINKLNCCARIIISLRNPCEVLFSHYVMRKDRGQIDISFSEYVQSYTDEMKDWILESLKYKRNLERFSKEFGWERVYVMIFDDFKVNPLKEVRKIFEFLGVDPFFEPEIEVHNPRNIVPKNVFIFSLKDYIPNSWRFHIKTKFPFIYNLFWRLTTKVTPRREMSEEEADIVKQQYFKEVRETSKLLGRDLMHWVK